MEESPSWKSDNRPAGEEMPIMVYNSSFIVVFTVIEPNTEPDESSSHFD